MDSKLSSRGTKSYNIKLKKYHDFHTFSEWSCTESQNEYATGTLVLKSSLINSF